MSRNSAKDQFNWIALTRQSAERFGFGNAQWPLEAGSFGLGGEVSPYVAVRLQQVTHTDIAPEAFIGIYSEPFERAWGERLKRTSLPPRFQESPPFVLNALNVEPLSRRPWVPRSPSEPEIAELRAYLERTFNYAKCLPSSVGDLVAAIEADRIGDDRVEAYLGHPVKVRGFVDWLRRTIGVDLAPRLLPKLMDLTEPYDLKAMLGTD
jgi:hypothetical protein